MDRDWSNVLGGGTNGMGGSGIEGVYPAKYNFDITQAPSCTGDFVVYPTNAPGATEANLSLETYTSKFTGDPGQGSTQTVTIGLPGARQVVLISSLTDNTGKFFKTSSDNAQNATNLAAAVNRWASQTGFSATSSGSDITITSKTNGDIANNAINETLTNFAGDNNWPGKNGSGTAGQPTIIAFNQLYQGAGACNGTWNGNGAYKAPRVMWSYNTGTGYRNETSPVLSYQDNGKQVAFVQRNGGTLQLVLLKWADGQGTAEAPATPVLSASAAAYRACASNCYYTFTFMTGGADTPTWSSPFVDYPADILWVGDTQGKLHKFTGVFNGTPAMVTTGGFPVTVEAGLKLGSPSSDGTNVYVGSQAGTGVGGKMNRVNSSTAALARSIKLANNNTIGLREAPIIDIGTGNVYGFLFNDGTAGDGSTCVIVGGQNNACRVIARFAVGFADGAAPVQRTYVGRGNNPGSTLFSGAFDDAYYTSANGTGAMYIVGGAPNDTFVPTLWRIPLSAGAMGVPSQGPTVGSKNCSVANYCTVTGVFNWSPVSVIKSSTAEYLYFSMDKDASFTGCTGACLYMVNLAGAWTTTKTASANLALPAGSGTTGIVLDNVNNSATGARQIYFSHTGTTGNAVQASQSALD
ncbi:MAG: hypothetical protein KGL91_05825 [Xanthomonadaceae bacterium]|nr:hypothetical protein [Xanthomonadaceae bacterium]